MSRTNARKNAFYLLFQHDFVGSEQMSGAKDIFFKENEEISEADKAFILKNVDGVLENIEEIDGIIDKCAKGWTTSRMAKVDLAILRLAVYEMKFSDETPRNVVINEAVELSKKFAGENDYQFINGVLGAVSKELRGNSQS